MRSNATPQRAKNTVNQRANETQWWNYLPQRAEVWTYSFFLLTIKLSASTGKEYCESTDKCNSKVKLFTSTGRDLDYIREYLRALVHNQRSASFDKCVYSFSILFCDVTIHGFNNNNTAVTIRH